MPRLPRGRRAALRRRRGRALAAVVDDRGQRSRSSGSDLYRALEVAVRVRSCHDEALGRQLRRWIEVDARARRHVDRLQRLRGDAQGHG